MPGMKHLLSFCMILFVAVAATWGLAQNHNAHPLRMESLSDTTPISGDETDSTPRPHPTPAPLLVVDVEGEVRRPGLHQIRAGSRVADAIAAAGGVLPGAEVIAIDRAERLDDGKEIIIPARDHASTIPVGVVDSTTASRPRRKRGRHHRRPKSQPTPAVQTLSVDVNHADAAVLAKLPGLDAVLAARIVALRSVSGDFDSLDDLLDVEGINDARLRAMLPYVRLSS